MSTHLRLILSVLLAASWHGGPSLGDDEGPTASWPGSLQRSDGRRLPGKLIASGASEFRFVADGSDVPTRLETGAVIAFDAAGPDPTAGSPPFRMELGLGRRISGRMGKITNEIVKLQSS